MEREQPLLDIRFTGMREQLVANACNFCFQLQHIQFLFANDDGFAIFCGRSHFLHLKQIANQVVHMRFAHPAHHAINFQYCFYHFKTQLSFFFIFHSGVWCKPLQPLGQSQLLLRPKTCPIEFFLSGVAM